MMNGPPTTRLPRASPSSSDASVSAEPDTPQNGKRRQSRAGTRSVNNLTQEQLDRKRQNDREAQRNIRRRTKEHIQRLESEVAELRRTIQSNEQLVVAEREIQRLKDENYRLRERLEQYESSSPSNLSDQRIGGSAWDETDVRRPSLPGTIPFQGPHGRSPAPPLLPSTHDVHQSHLALRPVSQSWPTAEGYGAGYRPGDLTAGSAPTSIPAQRLSPTHEFGGWSTERPRHVEKVESLESQPYVAATNGYGQMLESQRAPPATSYPQHLPPIQPGQTMPIVSQQPTLQTPLPLQHGQQHQMYTQHHNHSMAQYGPLSQQYMAAGEAQHTPVSHAQQTNVRQLDTQPPVHTQQLYYQTYPQPGAG